MKKVVSRDPAGRKVVINLFEQPVPVDGSVSAAEFMKRLDEERAYDRKLDQMAGEVEKLLSVAEAGENAIDYWRAGRILADHEARLGRKVATAGEERRYEQKGRTRSQLEDKIQEIRRGRKLPKDRYSAHYFRKFIRFATMMTEAQALRRVAYSLQHELLYDDLTREDRDAFLDRCERGEYATADALRTAVKLLRAERIASGAELSTGSRSAV